MKKTYYKIPPDAFKNLDYKIEASPFGDKPCCCGFENCIELECFMESLAEGRIL